MPPLDFITANPATLAARQARQEQRRRAAEERRQAQFEAQQQEHARRRAADSATRTALQNIYAQGQGTAPAGGPNRVALGAQAAAGGVAQPQAGRYDSPLHRIGAQLAQTPGAGQQAMKVFQAGEDRQRQQRQRENEMEREVLKYAAEGRPDIAKARAQQLGVKIPDHVLRNSLMASALMDAEWITGGDGAPYEWVTKFTKAYMDSGGDVQKAMQAAGTPSRGPRKPDDIIRGGDGTLYGIYGSQVRPLMARSEDFGQVPAKIPKQRDSGNYTPRDEQRVREMAKDAAMLETDGAFYDFNGEIAFDNQDARRRYQEAYQRQLQALRTRFGGSSGGGVYTHQNTPYPSPPRGGTTSRQPETERRGRAAARNKRPKPPKEVRNPGLIEDKIANPIVPRGKDDLRAGEVYARQDGAYYYDGERFWKVR